jgi:hypothetical protein
MSHNTISTHKCTHTCVRVCDMYVCVCVCVCVSSMKGGCTPVMDKDVSYAREEEDTCVI